MIFGGKKTKREHMRSFAERMGEPEAFTLIDVRTEPEYAGGHLPHSINIPLDRIRTVQKNVQEPNEKIYVYCQSGIRSRSACAALVKMGYTDITDLGGIAEWNGMIEK